MNNASWLRDLFVRGQSFSVKIFDRSRSGWQVIRPGAGNDFHGPLGQALPLPSRVSLSRARSFLRPNTSKHLLRRLLKTMLMQNFGWQTRGIVGDVQVAYGFCFRTVQFGAKARCIKLLTRRPSTSQFTFCKQTFLQNWKIQIISYPYQNRV